MKIINLILLIFMLFLNGCKEKDNKSAVEIHWDRDMCERCKMVVSDRKNTTQVRDIKTGKTYMFDDIGCAILWFKQETNLKEENSIIWITDLITGELIDAKKAFYTTDNITPMAYGFSAYKNKKDIQDGKEIIDYNEVKRRVIKIGK